jgi:hypothetical protein
MPTKFVTNPRRPAAKKSRVPMRRNYASASTATNYLRDLRPAQVAQMVREGSLAITHADIGNDYHTVTLFEDGAGENRMRVEAKWFVPGEEWYDLSLGLRDGKVDPATADLFLGPSDWDKREREEQTRAAAKRKGITIEASRHYFNNPRRRNPAPKYICTNDRYCPTGDTFSSLSDFQAMCQAVFGVRVPLASIGGDTYVDERGEVVLRPASRRPARRPAAQRKNPTKGVRIGGPAVKTLVDGLRISKADAQKLKDMMDTGAPRILQTADKMMNGNGVERISGMGGGLMYVNMGDTYDTTIIYDYKTDRFVVSSWGDIVERQPRRFAD